MWVCAEIQRQDNDYLDMSLALSLFKTESNPYKFSGKEGLLSEMSNHSTYQKSNCCMKKCLLVLIVNKKHC